jgi:DNA helicase IV
VSIASETFQQLSTEEVDRTIDDSIESLRKDLATRDEDGRFSLTDADIVALIAIAAIIADEFDYPDTEAARLRHLHNIRRHSAVFIDEVQDFTEIEILLMGMTALKSHHQITLSGDSRQRLQDQGTDSYDQLFPFVPRNFRNPPIFLGINFRQSEQLANFTSNFRVSMQGDARVKFIDEGTPMPLYSFPHREIMARYILARLRTVDSNATIAIISPSRSVSETWFQLLEHDLTSYHRTATLSQRDDLTRRFEVHFTEARETKGLEFDVVVVPDLGSFALETLIGINQLYVAISRPKHSLLLGCDAQSITRSEIEKLKSKDLVQVAQMADKSSH